MLYIPVSDRYKNRKNHERYKQYNYVLAYTFRPIYNKKLSF